MESVKAYYATENFCKFITFNPNVLIQLNNTHKKIPTDWNCLDDCTDFNEILNHYNWTDEDMDCPNDMIDFIRNSNVDHCLMKKGDIIEVKGKFWIYEGKEKWVNVTAFITYTFKEDELL